ncbi:hypothetical protein [Serratia proteamaculans]|uniref:N-acetylglucosamine binding protein A domain-containing protein n=1 Tax=Serratia proteamaculans TaxID=28151 RepID=A0A5Q2VCU4_SERPR|nr:hypothetical protein [Serratia proteamaculans]QGH61984.1 hypothetical protein GHV41_14630 [Serratia proteamaculans]
MKKTSHNSMTARAVACSLALSTIPLMASTQAIASLSTLAPSHQSGEVSSLLQTPLWQYALPSTNTKVLPAPEGRLYVISENKLDVIQDGKRINSIPLPSDKIFSSGKAVVSDNGDIYIPASEDAHSSETEVYFIPAQLNDVKCIFQVTQEADGAWIAKLTLQGKHLYIGVNVLDNHQNFTPYRYNQYSLDINKIKQHPKMALGNYILFSKKNTGNIRHLAVESKDGKQVFTNGQVLESESGEMLHIDPGNRLSSLIADDQGAVWYTRRTGGYDLTLAKANVFNNGINIIWNTSFNVAGADFSYPMSFNSKSRKVYLEDRVNNKIHAFNVDKPGHSQDILPSYPDTVITAPVTDTQTGQAYAVSMHEVRGNKLIGRLLRILPDGTTEAIFQGSEPLKYNDDNMLIIQGGKLHFKDGDTLYAFALGQTEETAFEPQYNIDGNAIAESSRNKPHRISWVVLDKDNNRVDSSSGHLDFDGSDPMLLDKYRWPMLVSEAINQQGGLLKAGPKKTGADENIEPGTPLASQHLNWLWLPEGKVREGYHVKITEEALDEKPASDWVLNSASQQAFESREGDDYRNKTIRFTVNRKNGKQHYDITTAEKSRFSATADIARKVNEIIPDVRLGEKTSGNQITPLHSQYRNKIWVNQGKETYQISVSYEVIK